jgi:phage gpG-like protein
MSLTIRISRDEITPDLRKKIAAASNPVRILRAVGEQLKTLTQLSFRDPALRQFAWAPKKDGSPSNLMKTGMLVSSIRVTEVTASSVSIGTDRRYAAIHQLGGKHMPARPFFPFTKDGHLVPFAAVKVERIIEKALETEMKT